jgi:hypothetical protein
MLRFIKKDLAYKSLSMLLQFAAALSHSEWHPS